MPYKTKSSLVSTISYTKTTAQKDCSHKKQKDHRESHKMNNNLAMFILIHHLLIFQVKSQEPSNPHLIKPLYPILATIIGILSIMFSFTIFILAIAKFCNTNTPQSQNPIGLIRSRSRFSGIDKKLIESLPFFQYSSLKGSKEGLECIICLSKFEDTDSLRLLPNCKHAFHMNCIDKWLEIHSSCPLCRYKFDSSDLSSFSSFSNSLGYPNLELFIQREQENQRPSNSRFNMGSSFRNLGKSKKEELLIQESENDRKLFNKFKHKIVVSEIVHKSRWSDVNSSDLMLLNSEMINLMASKRFSHLDSTSGRFTQMLSNAEQVVKIKDDIERKRVYESKVSKILTSSSTTTNPFSFSRSERNQIGSSRLANLDNKRSMSEITNISRFTEYLKPENNGRGEKIRKLWLPIARRTVQWFVGRESSTESEIKRHPSNV